MMSSAWITTGSLIAFAIFTMVMLVCSFWATHAAQAIATNGDDNFWSSTRTADFLNHLEQPELLIAAVWAVTEVFAGLAIVAMAIGGAAHVTRAALGTIDETINNIQVAWRIATVHLRRWWFRYRIKRDLRRAKRRHRFAPVTIEPIWPAHPSAESSNDLEDRS